MIALVNTHHTIAAHNIFQILHCKAQLNIPDSTIALVNDSKYLHNCITLHWST